MNPEAPKPDPRLKPCPCPLGTCPEGVRNFVMLFRRPLDEESTAAYTEATEIVQATARCGMRGPCAGGDEYVAIEGWNRLYEAASGRAAGTT